jgi:pyrimidine-nucleoside phosphorylase
MSARLEVPVLIGRKRDGGTLDAAEITALVEGYLADEVSDAQMAALLMAGVCRGFDDAEAVALTEAYLASGDVVDLGDLRGPTVDKHSTGGVGDTTTLVVAPLLAAAGCQVAKLSGRGLGHTGGTLDKLEAIPGFRVDLDIAALHAQVEDIGIAVAAATAELVPADKRIYALRDVTGTVPSEALIAASVMSKKIAGGAGHIVLDVKVGDGAFMRTEQEATALARRCVAIGEAHDRRVSALVTRMSQPLGPAVGNALEVAAAVDVLRGHGGQRLRTVALALAAEALALTGVAPAAAAERVRSLLDDGTALEVFARWIAAQGGDPAVADSPRDVLPTAPVVRHWTAPSGTVHGIAARRLGELAGRLGAGRMTAGAELDHRVGLVLHLEVGAAVPDGPAIEVHAADEAAAEAVLSELPDLVDVQPASCVAPDVVVEHVRGTGAPA